jgi:uncharacterized protein (DUF885 family)
LTATQLADELLDLLVEEDPLNPFFEGLFTADDGLGDLSENAEAALRERALTICNAALSLDTSGDDRLTRAVVIQQAESLVARVDSRLVEHTLFDFNISPIAKLLRGLPRVHPTGAEREQNFLTRLAAIPLFLSQAADRHRTGVAGGRRPVQHSAQAAVSFLDHYLADGSVDPLQRPPLSAKSDAERSRLINRVVRPAFADYRQMLVDEIAPRGRPDDRAGLCWLPDGETTYAALIKMHTTTDLSATDIHRTGVDLVERFTEEYVALGFGLFGTRTLAEIKAHRQAGSALHWRTPDELLSAARATILRAEEAAPRWFGRLPSRSCAVEATPAAEAPHASGAYYVPSSQSRVGTYYANTYRAADRDRCISEAAAFHEATPGHHLQIALAQELTSLPSLRRVAWINAYLEGWAVYTERLADEIGLYSDDFYRLGMVAHELMRAARLVVDTGIHMLGWDRERVTMFLRTNTAMTELELQQEADRYIEMPGQALAYMIGSLEVRRLRARAELDLGAQFNISSFHDLVLGSGPLPIPALDDLVARWTRSSETHAH